MIEFYENHNNRILRVEGKIQLQYVVVNCRIGKLYLKSIKGR